MRCKGQAPWSSRWDPRCGMVGAPCDVMFEAHRVSGWGPSGVLGWSLHAVRTVSSRLVQALDDETTADPPTSLVAWRPPGSRPPPVPCT